jgi:hypothetical protein
VHFKNNNNNKNNKTMIQGLRLLPVAVDCCSILPTWKPLFSDMLIREHRKRALKLHYFSLAYSSVYIGPRESSLTSCPGKEDKLIQITDCNI